LLFLDQWFEKYDFCKISGICILFELGRDTWPHLIGLYRFGRIGSEERWILSDLDGSDQLIPLHFKIKTGLWISNPTDGEEREKRPHRRLGFWQSCGSEVVVGKPLELPEDGRGVDGVQ
jgi:hypothetical protein